MIQRPDRKWLAHGTITGVDFEEKVIEFTYQGDLMPVVKGRYAILPADAFHGIMMRLNHAEQSSGMPKGGDL